MTENWRRIRKSLKAIKLSWKMVDCCKCENRNRDQKTLKQMKLRECSARLITVLLFFAWIILSFLFDCPTQKFSISIQNIRFSLFYVYVCSLSPFFRVDNEKKLFTNPLKCKNSNNQNKVNQTWKQEEREKK